MTSDVDNSKFEDRLDAVNRALDKAEKQTGKRPLYFLCITDEPRRIFDKAARAGIGCAGTPSAWRPSMKSSATPMPVRRARGYGRHYWQE
jgi:hypothetical protein